MSTRSSRGSRPQNVLNTADDAIQKTRLNGAQEQGRAVEKSATSARSVGNELAQGILAQGELAQGTLAQGEFADAEFAAPQAPSFDVPQSEATLSSGSRFPAFAHRNFRLFWVGNLISLIGTWAQQTAQGWLMRKMTPDPALIAGVAACGSIPILLLTLYAGAVADRVDKRRTLLWTNWASLVLAAVLGVLVGTGVVQIWHIATVAFCVGIVNAFDIPVRQSFNAEMVAREDLPNAIALNSSAFNAARVLGPATGGWLLHHLGIAGCFFANSLSFVALIFGLSRMKLADQKADSTPQNTESSTRFEVPSARPVQRADIWEGFRFVRGHSVLWPVVLLVAWVSIFAMSFSSLLPVFAKDVFGSDERGFSILMTCNGVGALGSALSLAIFGAMRHKGKRLLLGALLFCLSVIAFASAPNLPSGCLCLIFAGWFLLTFLMTANTLVQTLAPDELRGRVFSLYSLALIGTSPLGAGAVGLAARPLGTRHAVQLGAMCAALFCIAMFLFCRSLWKEK